MLKHTSLILTAAALSACASAPDVTYSYYLPTSKTAVTLTQTIDCTEDGKYILTYAAPSIATTNVSDHGKDSNGKEIRLVDIPLKRLDSELADIDFSFNLFDDGRLKSINATSTGQGETIVKSAVTLISAAATFAAGKEDHAPNCKAVKKWGKGKPVTLVYSNMSNPADLGADIAKLDADFLQAQADIIRADADIQNGGDIANAEALKARAKVVIDRKQSFNLEPAKDETSKAIYKDLNQDNLLPNLQIAVDPSSAVILPPANYAGCGPDTKEVCISLRRTKSVKFNITARTDAIYTGNVVVPGTADADIYKLPIPDAALFGKETFILTLNDAGGIVTIDYGKGSGAASAMNAGVTIVNAITPGSSETVMPPSPIPAPPSPNVTGLPAHRQLTHAH
jgi:hypothetical protein